MRAVRMCVKGGIPRVELRVQIFAFGFYSREIATLAVTISAYGRG